MWFRAVWKEKEKEMEGTIPDLWIKDLMVYWPPGTSAENALNEKREPRPNWRRFPLIKIKHRSESRSDCENFDFTTTVESSDEEEDPKRKRKKKSFTDFVTDGQNKTVDADLEQVTDGSPDDCNTDKTTSGLGSLPAPPNKFISNKETGTQSMLDGTENRNGDITGILNTETSNSRPRSTFQGIPNGAPTKNGKVPSPSNASSMHRSQSHSQSPRLNTVENRRGPNSRPQSLSDSQGRLDVGILSTGTSNCRPRSRSPGIPSDALSWNEEVPSPRSSTPMPRSRSNSPSSYTMENRRSPDHRPNSRPRSTFQGIPNDAPTKNGKVPSPRNATSMHRSQSHSQSPRLYTVENRRGPNGRPQSLSDSQGRLDVGILSTGTSNSRPRSRSPGIHSDALAWNEEVPNPRSSTPMPRPRSHSRSSYTMENRRSPNHRSLSGSLGRLDAALLSLSQNSSSRSPSREQEILAATMSNRNRQSFQLQSQSRSRYEDCIPQSRHDTRTEFPNVNGNITSRSVSHQAHRSQRRSRSRSRSRSQGRLDTVSTGNAYPMTEERFQRRVIHILMDIRGRLEERERREMSPGHIIQTITTIEEFNRLEESLKELPNRSSMISRLSNVGGVDLKDVVKRIMERLMTNELMGQMNLKGKHNKVSFERTGVFQVVTACALKSFKATEHEIRNEIGKVLKYAPDRRGGGGRHRSNSREQRQ